MTADATPRKKANVFGLGLIGGSLALALTDAGYDVGGHDSDKSKIDTALEREIISFPGLFSDAEVTFVATPVGTVAEAVQESLTLTTGVVTDVGSVKTAISLQVTDPRFVPGHPMAGSELDGLDGADASMFAGAVWVLTPTAHSSDAAFAVVAELVAKFGAEIVAMDAEQHDDLVAVVSHVPHLTAATLMSLANDHAEEHVAVLRLAAGGFRDMTRVASGHPAIWLDVCKENREAIVGALDGMISGLQAMRSIVDEGKTDELLQRLRSARIARSNLPGRVGNLLDVVEVRVPIPDRAGAAAEIFSLAAELGVNTANFEVAHSVEGDRGILVLVIDRASQDVFKGGLIARGFRPSIQQLT